ncbi:unnamed protein product [Gongylonema pulchrum]|uniref:AMP-binding_C domain-containing protein n=1 Tax=Gongylonema pulchrum TaxID=637853 RepID=A0A183E493_9BILA|nr:unnamed protein product [Gongylonema pulchrum]
MYFDSDGFYFVVDRKKDLIKVSGMQVSPTELEELLKTHCSVADAGVVGVPDEDHGQVPKAFVTLANNRATGNCSRPDDIVKYVNGKKISSVSSSFIQWFCPDLLFLSEVPKAFVTLANSRAAENCSRPDDIVKYVNDRVAPHKHLRGGLRIVDSLPKTASGKISRKDLLSL